MPKTLHQGMDVNEIATDVNEVAMDAKDIALHWGCSQRQNRRKSFVFCSKQKML